MTALSFKNTRTLAMTFSGNTDEKHAGARFSQCGSRLPYPNKFAVIVFSGRNARLRPRHQAGYFLQSGSPCAARGRHNENGIVCGITTRGSMTFPTLRSQFREE